MFETTINLWNIILVGGGVVAAFATMRGTVTGLRVEMLDLKQEVKKLAEVLISVARQDERMNAMDNRLGAQGKRLDEMRLSLSRIEGGRYDQLCDHINRLTGHDPAAR